MIIYYILRYVLHQLFILKIHLFYSLQRNIRQPLLSSFGSSFGINRLAVFDDDMGFLYLGKMILKNITRVIQSNEGRWDSRISRQF